ncbi:hypothetical protein HMPREF9473_01346 [ [Hungatella hathewayi WAL-18680]|uniref:Polysaccharide biosynthesis protein C-terminal domain-containing protein n=2 Tax=Hungatella hathewayi TaxID=154046 RepID=G5ICN6_9FIRM|nr:hypothetical protein HMPREF9473_01346 [ [Hungatella hathewayi WAL-18680]
MIAIFVYMCSSAVAQATQIKVGYAIGAGQEERAKRLVMKSVRTSLLLSCTFAVLLYLGSNTVFSIFTQDPEILKLAKSVMKIDMFLEAGRAVNMVMVSSLLAAGDTKTPLVCGILSMWCLAIPAGYLLGVVMELGITGVWIGFAADEWCRAIAFLIRWRSNAWQNKKSALRNKIYKRGKTMRLSTSINLMDPVCGEYGKISAEECLRRCRQSGFRVMDFNFFVPGTSRHAHE